MSCPELDTDNFTYLLSFSSLPFWIVGKGNKETSWKGNRLVCLWADQTSLSAVLCNKSLNKLLFLVLGQLWSNNWKFRALINPQLMGYAKCYRLISHWRWNLRIFGLKPRQGWLFGFHLHHCVPPFQWCLVKRSFVTTTGSEIAEKEVEIDSEWFFHVSGFTLALCLNHKSFNFV